MRAVLKRAGFGMLPLLFVGVSASAGVNYADPVVTSTATLQLKTADMKAAAVQAFDTRHWDIEKQTETSVIGSLKGSLTSKIEVSFPGPDSLSVVYLTRHGDDYHLYKRLLNIRKKTLMYLTDCKDPARKADFSAVDSGTQLRRHLVYALSAYHWTVKSISESKIVATLPGRGRIEADLSADGTIKLRRWDDMTEKFTDPSSDSLVHRVQRVADRQRSACQAAAGK